MSDFILHTGVLVLLPALIVVCLTPAVIRLATAVGAIDIPNERKIHRQPTPRLGGVTIAVSFLFSLYILSFLDPYFSSLSWLTSEKGMLFLISLGVVFLIGSWDDLHPLGPGVKSMFQLVAATIAYSAGFSISAVTSPWGNEPLDLGVFDYPATMLWIVGVTNAFNLIDGLDGLASGTGLIASLTIFAIALMTGDAATAYPALCLAGAMVGFLWYNFHPARIFLGDSGSLFIGFTLSLLSLQSSTKGSTAFALLVPVLALGLPIMDTLLSMVRRFLQLLLPGSQQQHSLLRKFSVMFLPDKKHIHHQLIALGLSHRNVVLVLYTVSIALGCGAFAVTFMNNIAASLVLVAVAVATVAGIRQLRYKEMAILRNGVFLPIYEWPGLNRTVFQGFIDLGFCATAFVVAYWLVGNGTSLVGSKPQLLSVLPVVCGVQLAVFYISGLYHGTYQYLGIGDLLKILKTVTISVVVTGLVLMVLPEPMGFLNVAVLIADFYLLLTLTAGMRVSYHALNYFFRKEPRTGKKMLIYGANANGVLTLQRILHDDSLNLEPVGFLDDKPSMEGKQVNGYPVYGGHLKIPQILRTHKIEQILLSGENIPPEVLSRIQSIAEKHGIALRRSRLLLEDVPKVTLSQQREAPKRYSQLQPQQPVVGIQGS